MWGFFLQMVTSLLALTRHPLKLKTPIVWKIMLMINDYSNAPWMTLDWCGGGPNQTKPNITTTSYNGVGGGRERGLVAEGRKFGKLSLG